ncbi:ALK tyrosine kinase receptor [Varanus komodoensis]|nr:ALK tyrosine kinase receptor [Varanus komodoensis]
MNANLRNLKFDFESNVYNLYFCTFFFITVIAAFAKSDEKSNFFLYTLPRLSPIRNRMISADHSSHSEIPCNFGLNCSWVPSANASGKPDWFLSSVVALTSQGNQQIMENSSSNRDQEGDILLLNISRISDRCIFSLHSPILPWSSSSCLLELAVYSWDTSLEGLSAETRYVDTNQSFPIHLQEGHEQHSWPSGEVAAGVLQAGLIRNNDGVTWKVLIGSVGQMEKPFELTLLHSSCGEESAGLLALGSLQLKNCFHESVERWDFIVLTKISNCSGSVCAAIMTRPSCAPRCAKKVLIFPNMTWAPLSPAHTGVASATCTPAISRAIAPPESLVNQPVTLHKKRWGNTHPILFPNEPYVSSTTTSLSFTDSLPWGAHCSFEEGSCGWMLEGNGTFSWSIAGFSKERNSQLGESVLHTTRGHFLYLHIESDHTGGATQTRSASLPANLTRGDYQVQFSVYIFGNYNGTVLLTVEEEDTVGINTTPVVWERTGSWSDHWFLISLEMPRLQNNFHLQLLATWGWNSQAEIAVDNITFGLDCFPSGKFLQIKEALNMQPL